MKILYGFFSGIGDAVIIFPHALSMRKHHEVSLAHHSSLTNLTNLFSKQDVLIISFFDKSFLNLLKNISFIFKVLFGKYDLIVFSPHASHNGSSSKIFPFIFKYFKRKKTITVGNFYDNNSKYFDKKIKSSLSLSIFDREFDFLSKAGLVKSEDKLLKNPFIYNKMKSINKIVINPFAGEKNRMLPNWHYNIILPYILRKTDCKLFIIGIKNELDFFMKSISFRDENRLFFCAKSLDESIKLILDSRVVVTMDSGFAHIAAALDLNQILINGATDYKYIRPKSLRIVKIEKKSISCQPCNNSSCFKKSNYCMSNISPFEISKKIISEYDLLR